MCIQNNKDLKGNLLTEYYFPAADVFKTRIIG